MPQKTHHCAAYCALIVLGLFQTAIQSEAAASGQQVAKGTVFHDANGNQRLDPGERTLGKVRVSNGVDIVTTDENGRYELAVDDDSIVFVIKPSGWRTMLTKERLPKFYYIHKPKGSPTLRYPGVDPTGPLPNSIDFPMYPQIEPEEFRAVMFGDPQPRDQKEIDYIAHDVVEELIGANASFGVTLGDIMFDNLNLFQSLNQTIALIGIPWYNVIGNHDINFDAVDDKHSDESFERVYGPAYYSFDYGQVHFLVLDNVEWYVPDNKEKGSYRGGLGKDQMQFIRNDLSGIPDDQLVVLMMHIPLTDVRDRHELYRLIEKRPFCMSICGHTHHHEHRYIRKEDGWMGAKPHHHIINVTVSGSWWSGSPDERGIPHATMADGAPNGYSIITFDGNEYQMDFKAAGFPASYQMRVHAPEVVAQEDIEAAQVYVNVFNGSEKSRVEMRLGNSGDWKVLEKHTAIDPAFQAVADAENALAEKPGRDLPKPKPSPHLWRATLPKDLPAGTHLLTIRTKDRHGREYQSRRILRVE